MESLTLNEMEIKAVRTILDNILGTLSYDYSRGDACDTLEIIDSSVSEKMKIQLANKFNISLEDDE